MLYLFLLVGVLTSALCFAYLANTEVRDHFPPTAWNRWVTGLAIPFLAAWALVEPKPMRWGRFADLMVDFVLYGEDVF